MPKHSFGEYINKSNLIHLMKDSSVCVLYYVMYNLLSEIAVLGNKIMGKKGFFLAVFVVEFGVFLFVLLCPQILLLF